jgi:Cof subfamily protein (haloacid dehalogenase superfamily)
VYRLLAIDIDGTLVNSRNEVTPATCAALRRAGAAGIQVVLATGRRYSHALPLVQSLGIDVPVVTASGALIKHPADHRTIYQAQFERPALLAALAVIDRRGFDPALFGDTFAQGFDFYHARTEVRTPELAGYLALNPGRGRLWPDLICGPPPEVFAGFTMGTLEQMTALETELRRQLSGRLDAHVLRSPRYTGFLLEFSPAGVTKWSGLRHVAAAWGIEPSEMCAVGDDVNDIPMIRAAGLGIAMGNAQPAVKAAADRVAPAHDEDGLEQVVEWLCRENDER